jgi:hypothetical protein
MGPIWQILSRAHIKLALSGSLPGAMPFYMAESATYDSLFSVRGRGFFVLLQNWPLGQIGLENGLKSHASLALNAGLAHLNITRWARLGGLGVRRRVCKGIALQEVLRSTFVICSH